MHFAFTSGEKKPTPPNLWWKIMSAKETGGNSLSHPDSSMLNPLPVPLAAANLTFRQMIDKYRDCMRKQLALYIATQKTHLEKMHN